MPNEAEEAVRDGVQQLKILPLFMAGGAHVDRDIPEQVTAVQERFPSLDLSVLPPIGEHPRLVALMQEIAREYAAEPPRLARGTARGQTRRT